MGPSGYPQPGWQAPSGGGNKTPLILLAIVGIAVVAAGAFFMLSGNDDGSGPEGTVRSLVSAVNDQDCERAQELVTEDLQSDICGDEDGGTSSIDSIETADEGDSAATVTATITTEYPDEEEPYTGTTTFQLVDQDGSWLISGYSSG